ncbi:MAG: hypothetical protein HQK86_13945 [Nitrospinae bacterium]|nr:hypothetical protein [Nitrospinota bacterium]
MKITKDAVLNWLADRHVGRGNGVSADQLVLEITGEPAGTNSLRLLRTRIEELRRDCVAVCGTPGTGYFYSENQADINETCEWLYQRAMTTLTQVSRMKKRPDPNLREQLALPEPVIQPEEGAGL